MGALVAKGSEHHSDDTTGPKVSFEFDTFTGVGTIMGAVGHYAVLSPQNARELLWKLHQENLCFSWLLGFPGLSRSSRTSAIGNR